MIRYVKAIGIWIVINVAVELGWAAPAWVIHIPGEISNDIGCLVGLISGCLSTPWLIENTIWGEP